jgi:hypothetical protein
MKQQLCSLLTKNTCNQTLAWSHAYGPAMILGDTGS